MAKRKLGGLGKGLDSLFEDLPMTEDASPDLTRLPVREIEPDPDQPRKNFAEDAMAALAHCGARQKDRAGLCDHCG